jgi:hypothetical protein
LRSLDELAHPGRSVSERNRSDADQLAFQDEHRDVAPTAILTARRSEDRLDAGVSPGEVVAAELYLEGRGRNELGGELTMPASLDDAVVSR